MRALSSTLLSSLCVMLGAAYAHSATTVTNFSHDLNTKTGWTAVEGGEAGYVAGPDFVHGAGSHSSVTTATSQRQAFLDSPVDIASGGAESLLTLKFRVMVHNFIAAVNEAVARVGVLDSGAAPAEGQILNAWVTLRRVGSIELAVQRRTDDVGNWENVLNASGAMPSGNETGIGGYEYADFTVTRDATGLWTVDVVNGYGNNVLNFSATESTVATSSNLDKAWIQDIGGQWNGSETATYWDSISATSTIAGLTGDFNDDSVVNAADIDMLCEAIRNGGPADPYNVDNQNGVNMDDLAYLVGTIIGTDPGDTDTDTDVDLSDLGNLATNYEQAPPRGWAQGDFDCDKDVDLSDLGTLATFYSGGQAAAYAEFQGVTGISVPEPSLGLIAIFFAVLYRRGCNSETK